MENEVYISVIIPVYNVIKYLKKCVDSVIHQDFDDFEIIMIDDGSNDGSEVMCDEYARSDTRIKVIHKRNGGVSSARNVGIKDARGVYCVFLDGDDSWLPDTLSVIALRLQELGEIDCLMGSGYFFYDGEDEAQHEYPLFASEEINCKSGLEVMDYFLRDNCMPYVVWLYFVKTDFIKRNNIYFKNISVGEDVEWLTRLYFFSTSMYYVRVRFYKYRSRRHGSLTNSKRDIDEKIRDLEEILDSIINIPATSREKEIVLSIAAHLYIDNLHQIPLSKWSEKFRHLDVARRYFFLLKCGRYKKVKYVETWTRVLGVFITSYVLYYRMKILHLIRS